MLNSKHLHLIFFLCQFDQNLSEYVTRETVYGKIRGFVTRRASPINVEQYLGIPFASPPVGNLRFENPKAPKSWKNILDTLNVPPACSQSSLRYVNLHVPDFNKTSEDCLYLNVYVPQINKNESLSVLLYVHGGGNLVGMGAMFDGDVLAAVGHIIVVTFNYRLAFLGFAAARDEGLTGTYGFLDQVLAMEWVRNNIHYFGGSPEKVTIHGHSAGASDVGLHLVSPLSEGLFRRAIVHSGSPLVIMTMAKPEWKPGYNIELHDIYNLRTQIGNKSLKLYLQSLPVEKLLHLTGKRVIEGLVANEFAATVDGRFLKVQPEQSFEVGNFSGESFLLSFTESEWAHAVYYSSLHYPLAELVDGDVQEIVSALQKNCFSKDSILREYNLTDQSDNSATLRRLAQVESDFLFVEPMIRMANLMVKWKHDLYVSRFDPPIHWDYIPDELGTAHGKDLFYIFGTPFIGHKKFNFTQKDKEISSFMMKLYSNFVKYGFLTLDGKTKYKEYNSPSKIVNSIRFHHDNVVMREMYNYKEKRMQLWNDLSDVSENKTSLICYSGGNNTCCKRSKDLLNFILAFIYVRLYSKSLLY